MGKLDEETKAEISTTVAEAMAAYDARREEEREEKEKAEIDRKFTPGAGLSGVEVVVDAGDQPFGNMGEYLLAVKSAGAEGTPIREERLKRCVDKALDPSTKAPTGLGEHVPSEGAFLVAQEFIPTLLDRMYNTSIVYGRCEKQPIGANFNGFKIPAIDETSRADGSRWGGVQAYWTSEGGSITASQAKFRQISIELQKLAALCYVTDELLEDAVALEGYVTKWFPMEMGFKLDDAIINGDGSGKPLGILNSPARVTVAKETGQAATTIVTANVLKMWRRLYAPCWPNSIWLINQDTLDELATLVIPIGTAGALANLFQMPVSPAGPSGGGSYGTMLSRPVMPIEQAQTLGTEGDITLVDLAQYIVGEKGGMQAASSIHVAFVSAQTAFRFIFRTNGEPVWQAPLTPFNGTDTISPYVTLASRS